MFWGFVIELQKERVLFKKTRMNDIVFLGSLCHLQIPLKIHPFDPSTVLQSP